MKPIRQFTRRTLICIAAISVLPGCEAETTAPDARDHQVLRALLIRLLADPKFDMTHAPTNGAEIVLHVRTPLRIGGVEPVQIQVDARDHTLPNDALENLRSRNTPQDASSDNYKAVSANYTDLAFSAPIIVGDFIVEDEEDRLMYREFIRTYPKARGFLQAHLPGYSKDGRRAVVRAWVGPLQHGGMVTALLEKREQEWVVTWHRITSYA